jgi:hypothetical protein
MERCWGRGRGQHGTAAARGFGAGRAGVAHRGTGLRGNCKKENCRERQRRELPRTACGISLTRRGSVIPARQVEWVFGNCSSRRLRPAPLRRRTEEQFPKNSHGLALPRSPNGAGIPDPVVPHLGERRLECHPPTFSQLQLQLPLQFSAFLAFAVLGSSPSCSYRGVLNYDEAPHGHPVADADSGSPRPPRPAADTLFVTQ